MESVMTNEQKLSKLCCDYCLKVREGDTVLIQSSTEAEPLVRELYKYILKLGAMPVVQLSFPDQGYFTYKYGNKKTVSTIHPWDETLYENVSKRVYISCDTNSTELANVDHSLVSAAMAARMKLREITDKREAKGKYTWTIIPYPTHAMAQNANMSYEEYAQFVFSACKLDEKDFIGAWNRVNIQQDALISKFGTVNTIRVVGEKTDLTLNMKGRKWINCNGTLNMPDGEIFTSPVENSANGHIYFDYPTSYRGSEAQGVYLEFVDGVCTKATAEKGEDYLNKMLEMDNGSRKVGEFAIGTNHNITQPTKDILFDEKIGGTVHLAVGASYPEAGGKNKSGLHWDLIKNMTTPESAIYFDGVKVYENGEFII